MAESGGLENRCGATHRGFESHPLRVKLIKLEQSKLSFFELEM